MKDTVTLHQTPLALWQSLIHEAQSACRLVLSEELESYLVFLLIRFTSQPTLLQSLLSLELLTAFSQSGALRQQNLREVGDKCLLFAGMFPNLARKRRVPISYFIKIGQSAYLNLADSRPKGGAILFNALHEHFVGLIDILHTTRELQENAAPSLDPIEAEELWRDTKSLHALKTLHRYTKAIPFLTPSQSLN